MTYREIRQGTLELDENVGVDALGDFVTAAKRAGVQAVRLVEVFDHLARPKPHLRFEVPVVMGVEDR